MNEINDIRHMLCLYGNAERQSFGTGRDVLVRYLKENYGGVGREAEREKLTEAFYLKDGKHFSLTGFREDLMVYHKTYGSEVTEKRKYDYRIRRGVDKVYEEREEDDSCRFLTRTIEGQVVLGLI